MSDPIVVAGRYRLERVVGRGGMGSVYRARDDVTGRDVAVKLMAEHLSGDDLAVRRFKHEGAISGRLSHPNIAAGLDAGYDEGSGRRYIVIEYVPGQDAAALLRRAQRPTLREAVDVVVQVCRALTYTHRHGVVHGDVSPANIIIRNNDRRAKLTDFGLASTTGAAAAAGGAQGAGTPGYAAPEVFRGDPATPLSDVYSIGATAYRMLVGNRRGPRAAHTHRETVALVPFATVLPPLGAVRSDLPVALTDSIDRAIARDAGDRHQSAAELQAELMAAVPRVCAPLPALAQQAA